jgi:signal transduction histidine kinase
VTEDIRTGLRQRAAQALAFARSAEPRSAPSRRAQAADVLIAAAVLTAALLVARFGYFGPPGRLIVNGQVVLGPRPTLWAHNVSWGPAVASAGVLAGPLAVRHRYPLGAFAVLLAGVLVTRRYATDATFVAVILSAYSAVACSRLRGAALLCVPAAGVLLLVAFWTAAPSPAAAPTAVPIGGQAQAAHPGPKGGAAPGPAAAPTAVPIGSQAQAAHPGPKGGMVTAVASSGPWRGAAVLVLVSLFLIAIVGNAVRLRDARARLRAEHQASTRRAVERERARIAAELHDVVTHSVSVMIVQAGAARQVLDGAPDEARAALLAVEASGRAAMTELRHLLGLLSPDDPAEAGAGAAELRPQPGLAQLPALVDRVTAAGLPVGLHVGPVPPDLPPGLDLAAFRVIQEALTNVLKHAGKPCTEIRLGCADGELVVEVTDAGRLIPAAAPAPAGMPGAGILGTGIPGTGRGLLGLRERTALYGGELSAGPRPGGGWRVTARIPVPAAPAATPPAGPGTVPARPSELAPLPR